MTTRFLVGAGGIPKRECQGDGHLWDFLVSNSRLGVFAGSGGLVGRFLFFSIGFRVPSQLVRDWAMALPALRSRKPFFFLLRDGVGCRFSLPYPRRLNMGFGMKLVRRKGCVLLRNMFMSLCCASPLVLFFFVSLLV